MYYEPIRKIRATRRRKVVDMRALHLPPSQLRDLIQRYEAGETMSELAREVGRKDLALKRCLVKGGLRLRTRKEVQQLSMRKLRVDIPPEITDAYAAGMGFAEIE